MSLSDAFTQECEFAPGDIALFVKWLGWFTSPDHLNNDSDLRERETWFWVSSEAVDALRQSLWDEGHWDQVPPLLPQDLPALDGIMVLADPFEMGDTPDTGREDRSFWMGGDGDRPVSAVLDGLVAVRWSARSTHLVIQPIVGESLLSILRHRDPDLKPGDLVYGLPPNRMMRADTWRTVNVSESDFRFRHAPRSCLDGSPLCLAFKDAQIWQWARRSKPEVYDVESYHTDFMDWHTRPDGPPYHEMPLMAPVPFMKPWTTPVAAEDVSLPAAADVRRLIAERPLPCHPGDAALGRLLHCLWSFAAQPLPANTPRRLARDIPKSRRHDRPSGGIRVMTLREDPGSTGAASPGRRRPRRHLVRGHWRRHWYPSLQDHQLRWIAPFLRAGSANDDAIEGARTVRSVPTPSHS